MQKGKRKFPFFFLQKRKAMISRAQLLVYRITNPFRKIIMTRLSQIIRKDFNLESNGSRKTAQLWQVQSCFHLERVFCLQNSSRGSLRL